MALPTQQAVSSWGSYMKLLPWKNKFRVVTDVQWGYVVWDKTQSPNVAIRDENTPLESIGDQKSRMFWAFGVIDRADGEFKLLEIVQQPIQEAIRKLAAQEEYGDVKNFDVVVEKSGSGLQTRYQTMPMPPKALTKEEKEIVKNNPLNLANMFTDESVFISPEDADFDNADVSEDETFGADKEEELEAPDLP